MLAEDVVGVALPDDVLLVEVGRAKVDLDRLLLRGGLLGDDVDFRSGYELVVRKNGNQNFNFFLFENRLH